MPLVLPDLSATKCRMLRICGRVTAFPNQRSASFDRSKGMKVAEYVQSGVTHFVRIVWDEGSPGIPSHLHFDFATRDWLVSSGVTPKASIEMESIESLVELLAGSEYKSDIDGVYSTSDSDVPIFVRSLAPRRKLGEIEVELTSGTLAIYGAPIRTVRWEKMEQGSNYLVVLTCTWPQIVSDDMFAVSLENVESAILALSEGGSL